MPEEHPVKHEQLVEELEELILQLSQQADIRANATQIYAEDAEKREKKRWGIFLVVVTSVLLGLAIVGFETWERHYERLNELQHKVIRLEDHQSYIRKRMLDRYEFDKRLLEFHKLRDNDRTQALKHLKEELRREIDKLHPRKK